MYHYNVIYIMRHRQPGIPPLLVGMLLVSKYGLMEEDAVEVLQYYGFHLSSSFLMYNFKSF